MVERKGWELWAREGAGEDELGDVGIRCPPQFVSPVGTQPCRALESIAMPSLGSGGGFKRPVPGSGGARGCLSFWVDIAREPLARTCGLGLLRRDLRLPPPNPTPDQTRKNLQAVGEAVWPPSPSWHICPLLTRTDIQPKSSERARDRDRSRERAPGD